MPHVFIIIDVATGEVLAANLSIHGAWLSAMRYGPDELLLPDGSELTVEGLIALWPMPRRSRFLAHARGERVSIMVQRHLLRI